MGESRFFFEDNYTELDACWLDFSKELPIDVFPKFNELRRTGILCDVKIEVDGCVFRAHRIVLAATIPFFEVMFTTDMMESHSETVRISNVDAETMELILNFVYTGKIRCSSANLERILSAADFFQLSLIADKCADLLKERINASNVLGIRRFAAAHNSPKTVAITDRFIQRNFVEIYGNSEFLELDIDTLVEVLAWDGLHINSEEQIFDASMRWVEHDLEQRRAMAPRVLAVVRLPLLSRQFLEENARAHAIVRNSPGCLKLVEEALNYQTVLTSFKSMIRQCQDVPGIIYAFGGFGPRHMSTGSAMLADGDASPKILNTNAPLRQSASTNGGIPMEERLNSSASTSSFSIAVLNVAKNDNSDNGSLMEMYDPLVGRWKLLAGAAMPTSRSGLGVAVVGRRLFAIGGFDGVRRLAAVEMFDPDTSTWRRLSDLSEPRSVMCVAVIDECIYVFGGFGNVNALSSGEMYNTRTNEWTALPAMCQKRCAAATVVLNGYIYVMGGHNGATISDSVERFNPKTKTWEIMKSMGTSRCRLSAVVYDCKIYAAGGYNGVFLNSAEVYDPRVNTWTPIASMNLRRSRVSLVTTGSFIYAIGGYDGEHNLRSMEIYDPSTNCWQYGTHLVAHEGGVGAGVIPASPKPPPLPRDGGLNSPTRLPWNAPAQKQQPRFNSSHNSITR